MSVCVNCGWTHYSKYCPRCGTEYIDENLFDDASEVTLSSEATDEDRTAEVRRGLWSSVVGKDTAFEQVHKFADDMETLNPGDYLARFAKIRFSTFDKSLSDFLRTSEKTDIDMYAGVVLDYALGEMNESSSHDVGSYIKKAFKKGTEPYSEYYDRFAEKRRDLRKKRIESCRARGIYLEPRVITICLLAVLLVMVGLICGAAFCEGTVRHWLVATMLFVVEVYVSTALKFGTEKAWGVFSPIAQSVMLSLGLIATIFFATKYSLTYSVMFMAAMCVNGAYYTVGNARSVAYAVCDMAAPAMFLVSDILLYCSVTGTRDYSFLILFYIAYAVFYACNFYETAYSEVDVKNCIHVLPDIVMAVLLCFYAYFFDAGVSPAFHNGICLLGSFPRKVALSVSTIILYVLIAVAGFLKLLIAGGSRYIDTDDEKTESFSMILLWIWVIVTICFFPAFICVLDVL